MVTQRGSDTRYNTTGGFLETLDGSVWQVIAGGGGETISQDGNGKLPFQNLLSIRITLHYFLNTINNYNAKERHHFLAVQTG